MDSSQSPPPFEVDNDDYSLLLNKFGDKSLQMVAFNDNYKPPDSSNLVMELKYLRSHFFIKLNNGQDLECYICSSGALSIFNIPAEDIDAINQLTTLLVGKFKGNKQYVATPLNNNGSTMNAYFFSSDKNTIYFNKDGECIRSLPPFAFSGKVLLKVVGVSITKRGETLHVRPMVRLDQVKVEHAIVRKQNCVL